MICLHRLRPMPLPFSLVVKNGINILSSTSGSMPGPLSETVMDTVPVSDTEDFTCICGEGMSEHASSAFLMRFISTCSIWVRSILMDMSGTGVVKLMESSGSSSAIPLNSSDRRTFSFTGVGILVMRR